VGDDEEVGAPVKPIGFLWIHLMRFISLFLRMSLFRNPGPLSGNMLQSMAVSRISGFYP
jgi:hypothetical protein